MRQSPLITPLAVVAKVVAVLFWVFLVGIWVVPVAVDQTAVFGGPYLHGGRLIPEDFAESPASHTPTYRIRSGLLAAGTLLLIAIAVCPHKSLARHALLLWPAVVISALPAILGTRVGLSYLLTTQHPDWWSFEDSLYAMGGIAMLEIGLLSLPASLILNRILRKDSSRVARRASMMVSCVS